MLRERFFLRCTAAALWLATGSSIVVAGCRDDQHDGDDDEHSDEGDAIGTPSGAECPPGSTLTYDTFGQAFMDEYCVRCHSSELEGPARSGAPEGHDFDVFEGIIPVADHIDQYAAAGPYAVNTTMPPTDPKPTEEERYELGEWLACELASIDAGVP